MKIDRETLKRKLTSRKFWAAIVGFAVAILTALGYKELDKESTALIISGCASLCVYILGEGIADTAAKRNNSKSEE